MAVGEFITLGTAAADEDLGALVHSVLQLLFDLLALVSSVQRPHAKLPFLRPGGRVADAIPADALHEALHKVVVDFVKEVEALDGETGLARVPEAADNGPAHGLVHVGIRADDHRVRAAQLQRNPLEFRAGQLHNAPAGRRRAGEGHAAHGRMANQLLADGAARARDALEHARRQAGLVEEADHFQGRQGRGARRLDDDRAAGDEGRANLGTHQRQGKVPGDDAHGDADGLLEDETVGPLVQGGRQRYLSAPNLARQPGVELEAVQKMVEFAFGLKKGLALLGRQGLDDVVGVFFDEVNPLVQKAGALVGGRVAPFGEGLGGRLHGRFGVFFAGQGRGFDDATVGRVDHLVDVARSGVHPFAVKKHLGHLCNSSSCLVVSSWAGFTPLSNEPGRPATFSVQRPGSPLGNGTREAGSLPVVTRAPAGPRRRRRGR